MAQIAISYRRADSAAFAGRIYDRLTLYFRPEEVFIDVRGIESGDLWNNTLNKIFASCTILLVIIGPEWTTIKDQNGNRRLDNTDDFVRKEVKTVLERSTYDSNLLIIPILVNHAVMPREDELPRDLRDLAVTEPEEIRHVRFEHDMGIVIERITTHCKALGLNFMAPQQNVEGIVRVHPKFTADKFEEIITESVHGSLIRIWQTWTSYVETFSEAFIHALKHGSTIEILLLDPLSPCAVQRGKDLDELGFGENDVKTNIYNCLKEFHRLYTRSPRIPMQGKILRTCLEIQFLTARTQSSQSALGKN